MWSDMSVFEGFRSWAIFGFFYPVEFDLFRLQVKYRFWENGSRETMGGPLRAGNIVALCN
jgi:hypothetical protein